MLSPSKESRIMDEIFTFIVIWIVLYLINQFTKKMKKLETGKPGQAKPQVAPPGPEKPFWETNQPEYPAPSPPAFEEEEYEEEEYQTIEKLDITEKTEEIVTGQDRDFVGVKLESPDTEKLTSIIPAEKKISKEIHKLSLKKYFIWKEILDKPLSLRGKGNRAPNRVS